MRTRRQIRLYVAVIGSLVFMHPGAGSPRDKQQKEHLTHIEGEALVRVKDASGVAAARIRAGTRLMRVEREFRAIPQEGQRSYMHLKSPTLSTQEMISALEENPSVEAISPNYIKRLEKTVKPNDPLFAQSWGLHNTGQEVYGILGERDADIDAPKAWAMNTGSQDVVIAVIDTGVDYTHEDLNGNMWVNLPEKNGEDGKDDDDNGYVDDVYGYDFASDSEGNDDSDPMDIDGHGTQVAGMIAAAGDNMTGVAGATWNTNIMALKAYRPEGIFVDSDILEAIQYVVKMKRDFGVNVVAINASFGGYNRNEIEEEFIKEAGSAGIIFVASAGNDDSDNDAIPHYPSSFDLPNVISVAATDQEDHLASFSNFGATSVDIGAPGINILSTIPASMSTEASLSVDSSIFPAIGMKNAGKTAADGIIAQVYDCGFGGSTFPDGVSGNIALIERGQLTFADMTTNAQNAGAVAVIIFNDEPGILQGDLGHGDWIPVVMISAEAGQTLLDMGNPTVTLLNRPDPENPYGPFSGTSAAAAYVSGAVALMAAQHPPERFSARIRRILSGVDCPPSMSGIVSTDGRLNLSRSIAMKMKTMPWLMLLLDQ